MQPGRIRLYDLSLPLGEITPAYPGDVRFQRTVTMGLDRGDGCELSHLELSAHSGTHLDLPAHFVAGGERCDDAAPERFLLPARVLDVGDARSVGPEALMACAVDPGWAILLKTANSAAGILRRSQFETEYVYLEEAAARACLALRPALVGIDALSIDRFDAPDAPAHRLLLGHGIPILEGIDLAAVPAGCYTLVALPLKIVGGEASPVRALLLPLPSGSEGDPFASRVATGE